MNSQTTKEKEFAESLRSNPSRIIVGEVRDPKALKELMSVMSKGHMNQIVVGQVTSMGNTNH